ncbi:MAG: hypothetical protein F6K65_04540 [Moorea sp. SIO3C2]|nr:hypothetical protein [Moorena sp. SIO3C2]
MTSIGDAIPQSRRYAMKRSQSVAYWPQLPRLCDGSKSPPKAIAFLS